MGAEKRGEREAQELKRRVAQSKARRRSCLPEVLFPGAFVF
jgi:hypothetical protein